MSLIEINFLRPSCGTGSRFQVRRVQFRARLLAIYPAIAALSSVRRNFFWCLPQWH